jgi:hypothetical protein
MLRYEEERFNLINICFGDDEKLVSSIKQMENNLQIKKASVSTLNPWILRNQNIITFESMNPPDSNVGKIRESGSLNKHPRIFLEDEGGAWMKNQANVLVNWILFFNISVYEVLDLIEPCSNQELSNWFIEDFCHLLVTSTIPELKQHALKHFQENHELLLQKFQLKGVQLKKEAFDISFLIMKHWYQNHQTDVWKKIANSNHD